MRACAWPTGSKSETSEVEASRGRSEDEGSSSARSVTAAERGVEEDAARVVHWRSEHRVGALNVYARLRAASRGTDKQDAMSPRERSELPYVDRVCLIKCSVRLRCSPSSFDLVENQSCLVHPNHITRLVAAYVIREGPLGVDRGDRVRVF